MKLTKRGKKARALLILGALILTVWAVHFLRTHHSESYKCHQTPEGRVCSTHFVPNHA